MQRIQMPPMEDPQNSRYPWLVYPHVHTFENGDLIIDGNNSKSIAPRNFWRAFRKNSDGTSSPIRDEWGQVKFFGSAIEAARALGYDCYYESTDPLLLQEGSK